MKFLKTSLLKWDIHMKTRFFKHLRLINKHRRVIFGLCCKCGIIWQGLVHDLSKYSITEFRESVNYYTGRRSPIEVCRKKNGFSLAWIHHKAKNKHHVEYWYDQRNSEQVDMPYKYAVEFICDKIAAMKCYLGKKYKPELVLDRWLKSEVFSPTNERMTRFYITVFKDLSMYGEKHILNKSYLKEKYNTIVKNK